VHAPAERFRFGRNVGILASGEVLSRGLTFLAFARLARLLSLSGYGLLELAQALLIFLTLLADLGTGKTGTREIAANGGAARPALVRAVISVQLLLAMAIVALLGAIGSRLPIEPALTRLLLGFAVSLLGYPFLLGWVFQGRSQMAPVAVLQVARRAVFLTVTMIVVRSPTDLFRVPWAEFFAVAFAATGYVVLLRSFGKPIPLGLGTHRHRDLLRESLPIGGSQLVWAGRMYLPMLVLASYSSRVSIGFFGAALRIVMVAQTLLATYFTTLFPAISEVSDSPAALATLLKQSLRRVLWPIAILAGATTLSASAIIRLVFGGKFAEPEAITLLAVLIWILPILAWRRHYSEALIALHYSGEELMCSLFGLALLVLLTVGLSGMGVSAGAWAMLIAEFSASALTSWRLKRHLTPPLRADRH